MPSLARTGAVFVLTLGDGENRLNPAFLAEVGAALDEVEATPGTALVTTGVGKQYSSGLDLDWMAGVPAEESRAMLDEAHRLLARLLVFPAYTVAAVNGHCFAAGAMLAAAHDARVMRADRGFWCLPEVDIGLPFSPGMSALLEARLPQPARHEAMVTGVRWGGEEAARRGVVEVAVPEDRVLPEAVERAERYAASDRAVRQAIKRGLYAAAERALLEGRP